MRSGFRPAGLQRTDEQRRQQHIADTGAATRMVLGGRAENRATAGVWLAEQGWQCTGFCSSRRDRANRPCGQPDAAPLASAARQAHPCAGGVRGALRYPRRYEAMVMITGAAAPRAECVLRRRRVGRPAAAGDSPRSTASTPIASTVAPADHVRHAERMPAQVFLGTVLEQRGDGHAECRREMHGALSAETIASSRLAAATSSATDDGATWRAHVAPRVVLGAWRRPGRGTRSRRRTARAASASRANDRPASGARPPVRDEQPDALRARTEQPVPRILQRAVG